MRNSRKQGVALVVTLIMLSVITFLVVVFLLMSNRDRAATNIKGIQTDSKNAADSALAHAQAAVVASILERTNLLAFDSFVSTNYQNPQGFRAGNIPVNSLTNVGYLYPNGRPVTGNDLLQNIANQYFAPRPPVYVDTNFDGKVDEFRFNLDFNRNGLVDTNGLLPEIDSAGLRTGRTNYYFGDPEWIGILANPQYPHSGTNRFLERYAFVVMSAGKMLDINFIHNQAKRRGIANEGFYRNQGVGPWEMNLAAFLNDLNTNVWPVSAGGFNPTYNQGSSSLAYDDALNLVRHRYDGSYLSGLWRAADLFGPNAQAMLANNFVDDFSDSGPVSDQYAPSVNGPANEDDATLTWPGSPSTNAFYDMQELFQSNRFYANFARRLRDVGTNSSSYDRSTVSRLISQLGTETTTRGDNKININYANRGTYLVGTNKVPHSLTNLFSWAPIEFFTNAALAVVREGIRKGTIVPQSISNNIFNIEVYPTNYYSSALHRLLQVTANIYDATHTNLYPSVFRPLFRVQGTNVVIYDFVYDTNAAVLLPTNNWINLNSAADRSRLGSGNNNLSVYGIPLVIGAKKGLPNFNEFSLETMFQITRKLEVYKPATNAPRSAWQTNQMILAGISNVFGLEGWNSYATPYPRTTANTLIVRLNSTLSLTNQQGQVIWPANGIPQNFTWAITTNLPVNSWQGGQFRIFFTNQIFLSNSLYLHLLNPPTFTPIITRGFERNSGFPVPNWGLTVSNRALHYFLLEGNRIVDFVNLGGMSGGMNMIEQLTSTNQNPLLADMWNTNLTRNPSGTYPLNLGVIAQIEVSRGAIQVPSTMWDYFRPTPPTWQNPLTAIEDFKLFLGLPSTSTNRAILNSRTNEAPFAPNAKAYHKMIWQVNDPIVHYHLGDLTFTSNSLNVSVGTPLGRNPDIGRTNSSAYRPWGQRPSDVAAFDLRFKDAAMWSSENWDFPTNKFPGIGWLGRVHRGSPWQTIYLKPEVAPLSDWVKWANTPLTHPTNDWVLVDTFGAGPSESAATGQLSINQTNLAAWSAVLSGVGILTNTFSQADLRTRQDIAPRIPFVNGLDVEYIQPSSPQLLQMMDAINRERIKRPGQNFSALSELLTVPELTVKSPFLNLSRPIFGEKGMNDAAYERIPQQILSLLRIGEPRFVVYAYGQALRPAPNSLISRPGPFFQMCTNYQIAGESVIKAVVRLEGTPNAPRAVIESYKILAPE